MTDLDQGEFNIDIHHIFPRAWCQAHGIPDRIFNAIVNKTPISYKANRMIGGKAPSVYLAQLREHPQVQISVAQQDEILRTHLIEPAHLHQDDFDSFYQQRKQRLIEIIERAMGKAVIATASEMPADDGEEEQLAEEVIE